MQFVSIDKGIRVEQEWEPAHECKELNIANSANWCWQVPKGDTNIFEGFSHFPGLASGNGFTTITNAHPSRPSCRCIALGFSSS